MKEMLIRLLICTFFLSGILYVQKKCGNKSTIINKLLNNIPIVGGVVYLIILGCLFLNHVYFPLNLNLMEGTVLQHVDRAVKGMEIYPAPTAEFVSFAYNPLYYYLSVPFVWLFGESLFTLRIVAIAGTIGVLLTSGLIIYNYTRSKWWSITGVGLIASSYRVMDAYLDTAHSDPWMVFCVLLGTFLVRVGSNRWMDLIGIAILVASFWFKQHGALFVIGGIVYLIYREGLKISIPAIACAAILGPVIYLLFGNKLFGSHFHYFTYVVPSNWSELNLETITRFIKYLAQYYPLMTLFCFTGMFLQGLRSIWTIDIWHFQYAAALLSGFMGALDPGSADNVFIPMAILTILVGTLSFWEIITMMIPPRRIGLVSSGMIVSYGLIVFNPFTLVVSKDADRSYVDFIRMLKGLDGPVYAPTVGQLQADYSLFPAAHWVALEDMVRGPGKDTKNHPLIMNTLAPIFNTNGQAYILENRPLPTFPWLRYLDDSFELKTDLGERFKPLRCLPGRFDHLWPRYLYQLKNRKTE